jgi:hypothetical protein
MRVIVHYDPSFAKMGTWIINERGTGVRVRFKLGDAPERVVDAELHWHQVRPQSDGSVQVKPENDGNAASWITDPSTFGRQLDIPVEIHLAGASDWALACLRLL